MSEFYLFLTKFHLINKKILHRNEDNLSGNPVIEELKVKKLLKLRRRSLSPLSRVQTMIDSKNLDDGDITNKDNSK